MERQSASAWKKNKESSGCTFLLTGRLPLLSDALGTAFTEIAVARLVQLGLANERRPWDNDDREAVKILTLGHTP